MNPNLPNCDWGDLIDRARLGCDDALGQILGSVRRYLVFVAEAGLSGRVRSKFDASDVVQFSMIEARKSIRMFRGETELEFRSWVKKIVLNNLTDEIRRYTKTDFRDINVEVTGELLQEPAGQVDHDTPSQHMQRKEFDLHLAEAVSRLPPRQRFVIEARHRRGCNYEEIADQLGISEAAARKVWSRAAKRLRSSLDLTR